MLYLFTFFASAVFCLIVSISFHKKTEREIYSLFRDHVKKLEGQIDFLEQELGKRLGSGRIIRDRLEVPHKLLKWDMLLEHLGLEWKEEDRGGGYVKTPKESKFK